MSADLSQPDTESFAALGYLQVPQITSLSATALESISKAYRIWFEAMFNYYKGSNRSAVGPAVAGFYTAPLISQLAMLLGLGGRQIFDHLSPAMNSFSPGFRFCPELPRFDRTPWLELATNSQLLSRVTSILGTEVVMNARIQPVFRLHQEEMELMDRIALQQEKPVFECPTILAQHISATPWFMYCKPGLCNSYRSFKITTIIPLKGMQAETGTLWLLPGSHRYGPRHQPQPAELINRTMMRLTAGDLLLLHPHLFVSQSPPQAAADSAMWLLLQFHRPDEPGGFPHLPSLKIRTGTNLPQKLQWNNAWHAALKNLSDSRLLRIYQALTQDDADRLTNDYQVNNFELTKWD